MTISESSFLQRIGINTTQIDIAKERLCKVIQQEIRDVTTVFDLSDLILIYRAVFKDKALAVTEIFEKKKPKKTKSKKKTRSVNRRKRAISLTEDISYALRLFEHLSRFPELIINEMKTGIAIKYCYDGEYSGNLANYTSLKLVDNVMYGNLYLNVIRTDSDYDLLNIPNDFEYFRGYVMIKDVSIFEVIEILDSRNITFLKKKMDVSMKRRKSNKERIIEQVYKSK